MEIEIKKYKCPYCSNEIETRVPTEDLVSSKGYWDSMVKCNQCEGLHFKEIWPNGKIKIYRLEEE